MNIEKKSNIFCSSPSCIELVIIYLTIGFFIPVTSNSVIHSGLRWYILFLFSLCCLYFLTRIGLLLRAYYTDSIHKANINITNWVLFGINLFLLAIILGTDTTFKIRLKLSEKPLIDEIRFIERQIQKDGLSGADSFKKMGSHNAGLFMIRLDSISQDGKTIWFHTLDGNNLFPPPYCMIGGIVYKKDSEPPENRGEDNYIHLWGPWWKWMQDI